MKRKKSIIFLLVIGILVLIGVFLNYTYHHFIVHEQFTPLPLVFDPDTGTSSIEWNNAAIRMTGGFIKGKIEDKNKIENLVLRSLSPTPTIQIENKSSVSGTYYLRIENVNPTSIVIKNLELAQQVVLDSHTVLLVLNLRKNESRMIEITPVAPNEYSEFVILGDNRNGYETFGKIIDQINDINPLFIIDNGDLVFGGEPNKYRLFYETVSRLRVPLYTTVGNHDIREGGRPIYTKLFGPGYYSFAYHDLYFIFVDSSRGWTDKQAIPDEQYIWMEKELKKAAGKKIFVITHIPPVDPRIHTEPNKFPEIPNVEKTNWFEQIMNHYSEYKELDHGFQTVEEVDRFENLMSKYHVDTVFLSHIHSYYSYVKNGVRYLISGGAGAELLSTDSYYHYLRVKVNGEGNYLEMVQLPSPQTNLQDRYLAAIKLFAKSIFKEYRTMVIMISSSIIFVTLWILYITRLSWIPLVQFLVKWLVDVLVFAIKRFKELYKKDA